MKRVFFYCLMAMTAAAFRVRAEEVQDFARYQVILDKSPFGAVAKAGGGADEPMAPTFQRYQLVALVVSNSGLGTVQAVILDTDTKRTYFKSAGESIDKVIKVVNIDERASKVELVSGMEHAQLTFLERAPGPATPTTGASRLPFVQGGAPPVPNGAPPSIQRRIPYRPK